MISWKLKIKNEKIKTQNRKLKNCKIRIKFQNKSKIAKLEM